MVQSFEDEHEEDLSLGNKLKNLINIYRNVYFEEERINCGSAICKTFNDFMIFNLAHMSKEEILINQVLWKYYTDEQLIELNQQIVANIPAEEMSIISKWMIRSINNHEAIIWLSGIKVSGPSFVLQSILTEAQRSLPNQRFKKINTTVEAKAMVA